MKPTLPLLFALAISACAPVFHDIDGAEFLAARPGAQVDPLIAEAVAPDIRPQLQFPARIAVARIVYRRIDTIPADAESPIAALAADFAHLGTFTALTPSGNEPNGRRTDELLRQVAARTANDYLIVANLDISRGTAVARFVDVRNGYVYATATATSPLGGQNGFFGGDIVNPQRRARAVDALTTALLPQINEMLVGLEQRQNR